MHLVRVYREHVRTFGARTAQRRETAEGWVDVSWHELGERFEAVAAGLVALGHRPRQAVGLASRNMAEWTQVDLGILAARGVSVALYPTSTLEQARFILRDAGITLLFAGEQAQVDLGLALLDEGVLEQVVALDEGCDTRGRALAFRTFLALGGEAARAEVASREADLSEDDLCTLIYTSGTTGDPKGVMLDHANLSAAMALHDRRLTLGEGDVSLAMLPLTHVFERAWTWYVLYRGAVNAYLKDPQTVMDAMAAVRPTHMCAVPRLWEKAYAVIQGKVADAPLLRRMLFRWAIRTGLAVARRRVTGRGPGAWLAPQHALAERLVFSRLRERFGGRCRFLPVAGAALADEVNLFFQSVGLNLKYGYGLSETCATVSCWEDGTLPLGTIGRPLDGLEVRLGQDREIQVKGPTVMRGYWNRPEETARVMDADGFFHTGDAGDLDAEGRLVFIERIKDLMKTSTGMYVAPQRVEGTLGQDPVIEQVAVIADARNFVTALIVPCFERLEEHARAMGLQWRSPAELLRESRIHQLFEERIAELQKGLAKYEQVKRFTLIARPFSMELGELTPTLKLRRKHIEMAFRTEIEAMYAPARS